MTVAASRIVVADQKRVLYFGCWERAGHFLHDADGRTIYRPEKDLPGLPWKMEHMDAGLLRNGEHRDIYDGKVFWTCGGTPLWLAFFWWDRSVDKRGASNSGFYVQGFSHKEPQAAFDYACAAIPHVAKRQSVPLVLDTK